MRYEILEQYEQIKKDIKNFKINFQKEEKSKKTLIDVF